MRGIMSLGGNDTSSIGSLRQAYHCLHDTEQKIRPSQIGLGQSSLNFAI